jgi:glycosyltransferase involved in cell wall biosynthesis
MKTITIVGTLPPIKGISAVCIEQVKYLSRYLNINFIGFHQIYPESIYPGGTKENDFIFDSQENININRVLSWYNPLSWIKAAFSVKGNIVHIHWWTYFLFLPFFTILSISKLRKKKIVCTCHNVIGHESNFLDKFFTGLFLKCADTVICTSADSKKNLVKLFGIDPKQIEIIHLGIPNFLVEKKPKDEARKKLGIPADKKVLLNFGNIRKYKGVDILLKAFSLLQKESEDYFLVIAGKPWIDWQPYQDIIDRQGLAQDILLALDYVATEDVKYYFSGADLLVLPYTHFDAQSGPGGIALGYGLPLVVSRTGGLPELVSNDPSLIFDPMDVDALKERIKAFFDLKIGDHYMDMTELFKKYDWENITQTTLEVYAQNGLSLS